MKKSLPPKAAAKVVEKMTKDIGRPGAKVTIGKAVDRDNDGMKRGGPVRKGKC